MLFHGEHSVGFCKKDSYFCNL